MSSQEKTLYSAYGKSLTLSEWAQVTGIGRTTLLARVKKLNPGDPFEKALGSVKQPKVYFVGGDGHTLAEWAEISGIPLETLRTRVGRLKEGESFDKVLSEIEETPTYEAFGERHTLAEWAAKIGISKHALYDRLRRMKEEDQFESILFESMMSHEKYEAFGESHTVAEWSRIVGIDRHVLYHRLKTKEPEAPFESILGPLKSTLKYEAFGKCQTISEWAKELNLSPTRIRDHRRRHPELSFEEILNKLLAPKPEPRSKSSQKPKEKKIMKSSERFIPPVDYNTIKEKYSSDPESKFRWECFITRMRRNPFTREYLRERQQNVCPVCRQTLDPEKTWMHYTDYDGSCKFVKSTKDLATYPCPSKSKPNCKEKAPSCEQCMLKEPELFDQCMSKLILVHGPCNEALGKRASELHQQRLSILVDLPGVKDE